MKRITEAHIQKWLDEIEAKTYSKAKRPLEAFAGKYPTHIFVWINARDRNRKSFTFKYIGKPSFNTYLLLRKHFRNLYRGTYVVVEFDRAGVLFSEGYREEQKRRVNFTSPIWMSVHPGCGVDVYMTWMGGKRTNVSKPGSKFYGKKEEF
jgi:hypothetical protein